jgi:alpha-L-fucosidase
MRKILALMIFIIAFGDITFSQNTKPKAAVVESKQQKDVRMKWWREARFGMFIHWGLYAVPAGEWNGATNHAEWIRTTAKIPLATYDSFVTQFNPTKFDAMQWVKMAKDAGMKYIVVTTKHHDGFAMYDSKVSDFDIMSTPFGRDIVKELAEACQKENITLCFYHSIMDWHHPDYLPRRDWEKDRSADGAEFSRYIEYMKSQLKELLTNYGKIGVVWFDGEWESTWTHDHGKDLYQYVRRLQPSVVINNRVDKGRDGMGGFTKDKDAIGDFGTPEQEIPATGTPGVAWESCMTMNNNWGYNSHDNNWKSSTDLIHKLVDIASKGGNFLLNVGPTAEGLFPQPAIERLSEIGAWMKVNGESVYGTGASPFRNIQWGRCTQKPTATGTRLYLNVFEWPDDGKLVLPGLSNIVTASFELAGKQKLKGAKQDGNYVVDVSGLTKDAISTVIVVDIKGKPVIYDLPVISAFSNSFVKDVAVSFDAGVKGAVVRYTGDGTEPDVKSPIAPKKLIVSDNATVSARSFLNNKAISGTATRTFTKLTPMGGQIGAVVSPGLTYAIYDGEWSKLPDFKTLKPASTGIAEEINIAERKDKEKYAYVFEGLISIPADDVYSFTLSSDDGSKLFIDTAVIDNDGAHSLTTVTRELPLAKGYHTFKLLYFQNTGGDGLELQWQHGGTEKGIVPKEAFYRKQ